MLGPEFSRIIPENLWIFGNNPGMHELAIARNLLRQVLEVSEQEKLVRVRLVALKAGVLRQIVAETLSEAFAFLALGTVARGAKVRLAEIPARVRCRACGKEEEGFLASCPSCRSAEIELAAGRELFIDYIEGDRK